MRGVVGASESEAAGGRRERATLKPPPTESPFPQSEAPIYAQCLEHDTEARKDAAGSKGWKHLQTRKTVKECGLSNPVGLTRQFALSRLSCFLCELS